MVERKIVTGQGNGLGIGGCKKLCPVATGHGLVTLLSLSVSIMNRPLHKALGKSQTYYPEHILGYGHLKDLLLSCHRFRFFPNRLLGWFLSGCPCTVLSPGLRGGGLESKFGRGPRPLDRRVVGWFCLCLGYKQGVCFEVPSWAH